MVRKYLTPVAVVVVTLLCTANKCEDSNNDGRKSRILKLCLDKRGNTFVR